MLDYIILISCFRAGLVFCDPVLACITVTPSIMLNQLPGLVDEYACLRLHTSWNSTLECVLNHTDIQDKDWYLSHVGDSEPMRQLITIDKVREFSCYLLCFPIYHVKSRNIKNGISQIQRRKF